MINKERTALALCRIFGMWRASCILKSLNLLFQLILYMAKIFTDVFIIVTFFCVVLVPQYSSILHLMSLRQHFVANCC